MEILGVLNAEQKGGKSDLQNARHKASGRRFVNVDPFRQGTKEDTSGKKLLWTDEGTLNVEFPSSNIPGLIKTNRRETFATRRTH